MGGKGRVGMRWVRKRSTGRKEQKGKERSREGISCRRKEGTACERDEWAEEGRNGLERERRDGGRKKSYKGKGAEGNGHIVQRRFRLGGKRTHR